MIRQLRLYHFRNFEEARIDFIDGANVFVGYNGQGKSNILEAIYLLFTGESFRSAHPKHLVQHGFTESSIAAMVGDRDQTDKVLVKIQEGRKSLFLNDKKTTRRQLLERQPVTLFSPESLNAIKGPPDERRRLIDELSLFVHPAKEKTFSDFRRILRTRNQVLRDGKAEKRTRAETLRLLGALEESFLSLATEVTALRTSALSNLEDPINTAMHQISQGFPKIGFRYLISERDSLRLSHEEIHNLMRKRMAELQPAELATGASLVGPQKHDLIFLFGENDSRFYCSQGQQRSLILAFKLAQIVYHRRALGKTPILLLDDVLSELDGDKRKSFVELIKNMEAQIVITTTEFDLPQVFDSVRCVVKRVQGGRVHEEVKG